MIPHKWLFVVFSFASVTCFDLGILESDVDLKSILDFSFPNSSNIAETRGIIEETESELERLETRDLDFVYADDDLDTEMLNFNKKNFNNLF